MDWWIDPDARIPCVGKHDIRPWAAPGYAINKAKIPLNNASEDNLYMPRGIYLSSL
jgi:hypothetical protein